MSLCIISAWTWNAHTSENNAKNGACQNVCHQRVGAWHFCIWCMSQIWSTCFKLSLYRVYWELNTNVWHTSTMVTLTAGNWQLPECHFPPRCMFDVCHGTNWKLMRKWGSGIGQKLGSDTMVGTATFVTDKGAFGVGHCPWLTAYFQAWMQVNRNCMNVHFMNRPI